MNSNDLLLKKIASSSLLEFFFISFQTDSVPGVELLHFVMILFVIFRQYWLDCPTEMSKYQAISNIYGVITIGSVKISNFFED